MTLSHGALLIHHRSAELLTFDAEQVQARNLKAREHETHQHNSGVRAEHEFFGEVCDAIAQVGEIFITGPQTALADFRHYVEKHHPALSGHLVAWEPADHPTEGQLLAAARKHFRRYDSTGLPSAAG
ncbi:MAG: hypothetical protein ABIQ72_13880 [Usitatibacter sp.]